MKYFKIVAKLLAPIAVILLVAQLAGAEAVDQAKGYKYHNLLDSIHLSTRSTDFVPLTEFEEDQDNTDHGTCLEYLQSRPELIQRIRDDLGCDEVNWQLENISYRLLYVPESREDVAAMFINYSRDVIEDVLARTGLRDPYHSISIQPDHGSKPDDGQGIRAIIVQDLARQYKARYQFSGTSEKRIEVGLSGQTSIDEVGSYSSYLQYSEEIGDWQFRRDRRTIWKSTSANPYTVLMTPLEETLHIILREYTEQAILRSVKAGKADPSLGDVREIVEQWLAVEEAIVGGLVNYLAPEVILTRIPDLPWEWIQADLDTKARFDKYRFLPRAIALVQQQGLEKVVAMYQQDPADLRKALRSSR